jgi:hypothetical protein
MDVPDTPTGRQIVRHLSLGNLQHASIKWWFDATSRKRRDPPSRLSFSPADVSGHDWPPQHPKYYHTEVVTSRRSRHTAGAYQCPETPSHEPYFLLSAR